MANAELYIMFICDDCKRVNYHPYSLEKGNHKGKKVMKDRINCTKCDSENFVFEKIKEDDMIVFTSGDGIAITSGNQYTSKEMVNDIAKESRVIVCSAIRHKNGGGIICGPRHFDVIMNQQIRDNAYKGWADSEQGFVDQFGKFLTRKAALIIAKKQKQIIRRVGGDSSELFSENLY